MLRFSFLTLVLLLCAPVLAQGTAGESFWLSSKEKIGTNQWRVFTPRAKSLQGQAFLVHSTVSGQFDPERPREFLTVLHTELDNLSVLGQKEATWLGGQAYVVSFRAKSGDEWRVGRCLLAATPQGTEMLLLLRHPESSPKILEQFQALQENWPKGLPVSKISE